jgi:hypothetical protein
VQAASSGCASPDSTDQMTCCADLKGSWGAAGGGGELSKLPAGYLHHVVGLQRLFGNASQPVNRLHTAGSAD